MIDWILITLAFTSGLVAFFAPCSFLLLPSYITHYIGRRNKKFKEEKIIEGLKIGGLASIGFIILFGSVGIIILLLGQSVKVLIPIIAVATGLILIIIGILHLVGKDIAINMPHLKLKGTSGSKQSIMFGMAYAIASLGCTFPLFLSIVVMAIAAESILGRMLPIASYTLGMSILMISVTLLASVSKKILLRKMNHIMPYFKKISGVIMILAGLYMIYWQWNLLVV